MRCGSLRPEEWDRCSSAGRPWTAGFPMRLRLRLRGGSGHGQVERTGVWDEDIVFADGRAAEKLPESVGTSGGTHPRQGVASRKRAAASLEDDQREKSDAQSEESAAPEVAVIAETVQEEPLGEHDVRKW